jgi:O-antigen/teichoic acid export membrane protein
MTSKNESGVAVPHRPRTWLNGSYAIAEYASLPLGLLLTAPYLLRHMGAAQFGIWVLASAAVNSGNTASSGFGDAAVKYVAMYRGRNDATGIARVVRGMLSINLALGGLFAIALWSLAPFAAGRVAQIDPGLRATATNCFRIGSLLLLVRSIDGVFTSTLRAFERYSPAVRITLCSRIAALVAAVALVACGGNVLEIMQATLAIATLAVIAQGIAVRAIAGRIVLLPSLHGETLSKIMNYGCFSWLQAVSSAVFSQADRLVIGMTLGAPAVAGYALCAQAAQTIHGIVAAGFHALFPHLSSRIETETLLELRRTVWTAFKVNLLIAFLLGAPFILFSRPILTVWMGHEFAMLSWPILSILGCSFVLFALNVTAHYTLLAIGKVRVVTFLNLAAGAAMLTLMLLLTPKFGMIGTAASRLVCGPITCLLYFPLYKFLHAESTKRFEIPTISAWENS